jgi:hypothetical protein
LLNLYSALFVKNALNCCNFVKSSTAKDVKNCKTILAKGDKNMKKYKKNGNKILSFLLVAVSFLLLSVVPVSFGAVVDDCQVKVPLVIDLSSGIAGVQFAFEYSTGLEFVSYEKSDAVSSALTTPVVVKNGYTNLGFYNSDNRYVPENGKLDMGYLVFNCLNDNSQQVTLSEIKLVQVVSDGSTRSEFLAPVEIKVSPENNLGGSSVVGEPVIGEPASADDGASLISATDSSVDNPDGFQLSGGLWVVIVLLLAVACGAGIFVTMKKRADSK